MIDNNVLSTFVTETLVHNQLAQAAASETPVKLALKHNELALKALVKEVERLQSQIKRLAPSN